MKIKKYPTVCLALLLATGLGTTACNGKGAKNTSSEDTLQAVTSAAISNAEEPDTLETSRKECVLTAKDSSLTCNISVDWPTENDALAMGVRQYIAEELAACYLPTMQEEDTKAYPKYKGSTDDIRKMLDFYCQGTMKMLRETLTEFKNDGREDLPQLACEIKIRKAAEKDKYVTYTITTYNYLGGAHPSSSGSSAIISKITNKEVKKIVDESQLKILQPLLRKGLVTYFKDCGETDVTEETVKDLLLLTGNLIPLPVSTPTLEADGVHFIYQQYEIAPYAVGMPEFVIAYKDIIPYLTQEAKDILQ